MQVIGKAEKCAEKVLLEWVETHFDFDMSSKIYSVSNVTKNESTLMRYLKLYLKVLKSTWTFSNGHLDQWSFQYPTQVPCQAWSSQGEYCSTPGKTAFKINWYGF